MFGFVVRVVIETQVPLRIELPIKNLMQDPKMQSKCVHPPTCVACIKEQDSPLLFNPSEASLQGLGEEWPLGCRFLFRSGWSKVLHQTTYSGSLSLQAAHDCLLSRVPPTCLPPTGLSFAAQLALNSSSLPVM